MVRPNGLRISRRKRAAYESAKDTVFFVKRELALFAVPAQHDVRAGSLILPHRSRPRQAHAARRSFGRSPLQRAVLTRRGGCDHPAAPPPHSATASERKREA